MLGESHAFVRPGGYFVFGQDLVEARDDEPRDIGHPIRLAAADVDPHIEPFVAVLKKSLTREQSRNPIETRGTLVFAGRSSAERGAANRSPRLSARGSHLDADAIGRHLARSSASAMRYGFTTGMTLASSGRAQTTRLSASTSSAVDDLPPQFSATRVATGDRAIAIHTRDLVQVAYVDPVVRRCDLYLAITGSYWFGSIGTSRSRTGRRRWSTSTSLSTAPISRRSRRRSTRRVGAESSTSAIRGGTRTPITSRRSRVLLDHVEISWIGDGPVPIKGLRALGRLDFTDPAARERIAAFDFMLTVGKADANPTTILEAMAWGLIPVCTAQSGYAGFESIPERAARRRARCGRCRALAARRRRRAGARLAGEELAPPGRALQLAALCRPCSMAAIESDRRAPVMRAGPDPYPCA